MMKMKMKNGNNIQYCMCFVVVVSFLSIGKDLSEAGKAYHRSESPWSTVILPMD